MYEEATLLRILKLATNGIQEADPQENLDNPIVRSAVTQAHSTAKSAAVAKLTAAQANDRLVELYANDMREGMADPVQAAEVKDANDKTVALLA